MNLDTYSSTFNMYIHGVSNKRLQAFLGDFAAAFLGDFGCDTFSDSVVDRLGNRTGLMLGSTPPLAMVTP